MKVTIPEIAWHNKDPVFSADFSLGDNAQWRLATAGADSDVKVTSKLLEIFVMFVTHNIMLTVLATARHHT